MCFGVYAGAARTEAGAAGREAGFTACRLVHRYMHAMARRKTAIRPSTGPIAFGIIFGSGAGFLRNRVRCVIRLVSGSIMHEGVPATQSRPCSNPTPRWCILEESDDFLQRLCRVSGAPDGEAPGRRQDDR